MLDQIPETLDIVVSNPPYVSEAEYEMLPVEVKNFEPKGALLAGRSAIEVIKRLISQSSEQIRSGGHLLIEVSPMIAESVATLLCDWNDVQILLDSSGRQRIVCCRR